MFTLVDFFFSNIYDLFKGFFKNLLPLALLEGNDVVSYSSNPPPPTFLIFNFKFCF